MRFPRARPLIPSTFRLSRKSSAAAASSAVGRYDGGWYVPDFFNSAYSDGGFLGPSHSLSSLEAELEFR